MLHDRVQAEDAVQETWVKAFRRPKRLEEADLREWLLRLGLSTALDVRRRDIRIAPGDVTDAFAVRGAESDSEDTAALRAALAALDPVTRAAVWRRYGGNARWEDIAAELGLPVDEVRRRVVRALPGLKARLFRAVKKP